MSNKMMSTPYSENGKPSDDMEYTSLPGPKTFMGRTKESWGKIGLFYTCYYASLAIFIAIMFSLFLKTVPADQPKLSGMDSILKGNPGMSFKPQPDKSVTIVKFVSDEINATHEYIKDINATLQAYIAQQKDNSTKMVDCSNKDEKEDVLNGTDNKVCKFDLSLLGDHCTLEKHFGYKAGKPCILFKLNKIYGWNPELWKKDDEKLPAEIKDSVNLKGMPVTCDGENYGDKENIGDIKVFPEDGFRLEFFPYMNKKNYQAPLVFVQFQNLQPRVPINILCKVWAKNIYQHRNDRMASAHLEMLKVF